ncbi:MAG TPA: DUF998 domain-containing protein [Candidatus Dormibacteraeota bacterium]|nr:DUF998 domain-containing protein [Candidatus Dormibacteraeota bacterium]
MPERQVGVERMARDPLPVAGVVLFVLSALFMTVIMLGASMVPGYDMSSAAISDLGVAGQTAVLFNGTLIVVGILDAIAGYLLYRWHRRRSTLVVFVLAGAGAIGAGVFSLDRGGLHSLFALVGFLFFNIEALVVARLVRGPIRAVSLVAGTLGLAFVVLMILGDAGNEAAFGPIGHGGTERMIVYPPMVWMLALGGWLMAQRPAADPAPS